MDELSASSSGSTATDMLIESYKKTQQPKINQLNQKKSLLQSRQSFFSTFRSRIDSLVSQIDKFTNSSASEKFLSKTVTSSDSTVISAKATGTALIGSNALKVSRLASNDVLISNRATLSGTYGEAAGTQTFDITLGDTTKQVSIAFDGTETNEQAMKKIVNAVNLTEDIEVNASFVKDTSSTGRITFTSKNTGSENKIIFSSSTALTKFGIDPVALGSNSTSRTLSTDTAAGYRKANFEDLDSKFELNGINITRSSNSIDDVLDGVTINLLKVQESDATAINLTTTVDSKTVQEFVKGLLTSINDVVSNINNNRDIKRNDPTLSGLVQNIKNLALNKFGNGSVGAINYLSDIGIKFDNSGFLTISDADLFTKKLESDPQKIADIFVGDGGFADKLQDIVNPLKGNSGLIASRSSDLKSQIDLANKRISQTEDKIEIQANSLRKQYQSYLKLFYQAQNQNTYLSGFATTSSN